MSATPPPLSLLAEVTHRCPLKCPYCSNPLELARASDELDTATWVRVFSEAAELGCLQVHFSGGEPMARRDLRELVEAASNAGLYTNLITSGVLIDPQSMASLTGAGLEHVQLSFQDVEMSTADWIAGLSGAHRKKLRTAEIVREAGLPLTANFVVHRQNADRVAAMIDLAGLVGAQRVEVANVQYHGWALRNRASLMPTRTQLARMEGVVEEARARFAGRLTVDFVVPDYYATRPKACMGGWGRQFLNVSPAGLVLPCHAAETIPGIRFENVRDKPLREIWFDSEAFNRFRGTEWMPEPCRSCERAEVDWGGCRCQALAITGNAANTDPACELSSQHRLIEQLAVEASRGETRFNYRQFGVPA